MSSVALGKRLISLFMIVLVVAAPVAAQEQMTDYVQGRIDGDRDAKGRPLWFLAGTGCGAAGVLAAYTWGASPPQAAALVGKSPDYIAGYVDGYKSGCRAKNTRYSLIGLSGFVPVYFAVWYAIWGYRNF